ncbi:MAG TPA: CehA/McbA family metallohydrolase [Pirellulales bacterium]|nr:CehA/McbA family metallohydrolase [Pirellulales bacterium]
MYPLRSRRAAPDFFFHDQIYRHDGETIDLPPGKYQVAYTRGPEYRVLQRQIVVPDSATGVEESFRLERWIKMSDFGWYSGDHHIHAAGCSHYESPTAGVTPQDMLRQVEGEDLDVGCVLSWGPCWYVQKQYFSGQVSKLSTRDNLMRYDVEVSGFPSSHCGHVCLLRLTQEDYPGTTRIEQWPSWDLPVLQWGKQQGAVVGFAHSGWELESKAKEPLSYEMPRFDGIGANEYIVDVTQNAVDFISIGDTPPLWELPIWYHTLNCGFTTRIGGETDFPCIYDDRVGMGRSYVKIPRGKPLTFDDWVHGVRDGRSYCSDGMSHLFDFSVNGLGVGEPGDGGRPSFLAAKPGQKLSVKLRVAAMLDENPRDEIRSRPLDQKPYWSIERARVGGSRQVPVELVVNGAAVDRKLVDADGQIQNVAFDFTPMMSSWIAVRVFPSSHTNPIFVEVDGKPIRASRRSAAWCLAAVDVCWKAKMLQIRPAERTAAAAAYEKARAAYRARLAESFNDG